MRAGWGRLSDISSENCPWVMPTGRKASSKRRAERPRGPLDVEAQAAVPDLDRRGEGDRLGF
jgi:hypothetical protein